MTRTRTRRHARRGFTLVELMVATALVVLILTILAVAFGAATDSLSRLRSMGNMATDLRNTQDKIRADLDGQHFDSGDSPGILRTSDLRYHELGTAAGANVRPPLGGYFRLEHATGSTYEGADAEGLTSTRATAHAIEFTTKRQGESADDLFVAHLDAPVKVNLTALNAADTPLTNDQFVSKWARVRWFLGNAQTVPGGNGPVTVYTLYRQQRVVAPGNLGAPLNPLTGEEQDQISVFPLGAAAVTQTLAQLTNPANRSPMNVPYPAGDRCYGDDIVLSNVTSFEVKATWDAPAGGTPRAPRAFLPVAANAFNSLIPDGIPGVGPTPANPSSVNGDFPFDDLPASTQPGNPRLFDTGNDTATLPLRIRVTALQVKVRVFDPKTLLSRQVSFIVQP